MRIAASKWNLNFTLYLLRCRIPPVVRSPKDYRTTRNAPYLYDSFHASQQQGVYSVDQGLEFRDDLVLQLDSFA